MRKARQSRVHTLELANLNNSSGLWGIGMVSSCLVPGLRTIQGRGNTGLVAVCELDKEMVGLHMKDVFSVQPFAISKNWLVLGEAVSPQICKDPKTPEHQEYKMPDRQIHNVRKHHH